MRLRQGTDNGNYIVQEFFRGQATFFKEEITQGKTIDVLHDDKDSRSAALIPALILDGDDIGMGERGDRFRFADKTVNKLFVIG